MLAGPFVMFKTHGSLMADKHRYTVDATDSRVWMRFTVKLDRLQFCIEAILHQFILPNIFHVAACCLHELHKVKGNKVFLSERNWYTSKCQALYIYILHVNIITSLNEDWATQPPVHWIPGFFLGVKAAGAWRWPPTPIYSRDCVCV